MSKKELMIKAHQMTRGIKEEFPGIDYKFQLGLCISYLLKGEVEMVELKGTEKQVNWANDIRKKAIELIEKYEEVKTNTIEVATAWAGTELKVTETEIVSIYNKKEQFKKSKENLATIKKLIENEESAKFFIENKEDLFTNIARKYDCKCCFSKLRKAFEEEVIRINL
ncbi:hypothetical protein [Clostridium septicum]|uniref:hypothetical protein n=1 Tax=Clostridium septicum TaxID=1504 RepID=UPI00082E36DD|nr:hypothetical protein [Clostridium septicum]